MAEQHEEGSAQIHFVFVILASTNGYLNTTELDVGEHQRCLLRQTAQQTHNVGIFVNRMGWLHFTLYSLLMAMCWAGV
jgi:hypothetical protein